MSLETPSHENVTIMLKEITAKLQMINAEVMAHRTINLDDYEDLYDMYNFVTKRTTFSTNELNMLAEEIGKITISQK
ncbi:hypothetical protein BFR38_02375 [Brochothrix thermosphacta]|uniref:DUF1128 domain-containing protein n=1 Tax=Brochothrix thermosphacta TaxID=2756 RepID=UPI00083FA515|nr:DUF1128 family protein [Brochothrix thermosphacta]ODJ54043.1 hypothetical protein BFR38_02375 [Brochothrix thermosphacta]ODJ59128.1 hypothetical protein BFR42_03595 [Brochothrix thermosphacta]